MIALCRVVTIFLLMVLGGCSTVKEIILAAPESHTVSADYANQSVGVWEGYFVPLEFINPPRGCSGVIKLSSEMRLSVLGLMSHWVKDELEQAVFIPPAKFMRAIVWTGEKVMMQRVMLDNFLSAGFFNLPIELCVGRQIQAVLLAQEGNSIQTASGEIFGPMLQQVRGSSWLEKSVDALKLSLDKHYAESFFGSHTSVVTILPGVAKLGSNTEEDRVRKEELDALAKLFAGEKNERGVDSRVLSRTNFSLNSNDFLFPYGLLVKLAFFGYAAKEAADGMPHGFTAEGCFDSRRVKANAEFIWQEGEDWRRRQAEDLGGSFQPHSFNQELLAKIKENDELCVNRALVASVMEQVVQATLRNVRN